ncbi:MAG: hypothetical protein U1E28_20585 [Beijerinckiaceae bacterium]
MRALAIAVILPMACSGARAEPGDAEKARQMMERVVTAIHQDETAALQKFNAGTPGFRDGNIYPFCFRLSDGTVMTGQTAGSDIRTFPGVGQQLFDAAQKPEGETSEIAYLARKPPPAEPTPVKKVSVVRRIGNVGCGVGYYP